MAKIDWLYTDGTVSNVMHVSAYGKGGDLYAVTFTYKVDGHYFGGEFKALTGHGYSEGDTITVGYNPAKTEENDLNNKGAWMWWWHVAYCIAIVALVFFGIHGCNK